MNDHKTGKTTMNRTDLANQFRVAIARYSANSSSWNESDHPRDDSGKFSTSSGGGSSIQPSDSDYHDLSKSSKKWAKDLSDDQREAIRAYTLDSDKINSSLRRKMVFGNTENQVENIDSALALHRFSKPLVLFRGVGTDPELEIGDSFSDRGYTSTTPVIGSAMDFAKGHEENEESGAIFQIHAPAGTNGADMGGLTAYASDSEILLPRGCEFRVSGISNAKDGTKIYHVELTGYPELEAEDSDEYDDEDSELDNSSERPNTMNTANTSKNNLSGFALGLALVGEVARYCVRQAAGGGCGAVGGDVARYAGGKKSDGSKGDAKPNSNGEHWVTIGGEPEGDKKHVGGTPVKIDGAGNVVAGPAWVAKAGITKLGGGKEGGGGGEKGDSGAGGGAIGGEAAPAGTTGKLNRETMNSLRRGAVLKDKDGKEWLPHSYRHGFLTAHPVVDGKAIVNKESAKTFKIDAAEHHGPKDDVYVTDRNLEDEEIAAHRASEDEKKKQQSPIAPAPAASTAPVSPAPAASPKGKFEIPKYKRDNPPMVSSPTVLKRGVDVKIPHYDHDDLGRHIEEQKGTEYILPGLEQFRFAIIPPIGKVRIGAKGEKRLVEITSGTEVGHGTDENEVIRAAMARIQHHGGAEFLDKKLPEILENHADLDSQMPLMSLEQLNEKRREHRNMKLAEAANSKPNGEQQQSSAPEAAPAPASPPTPQANTAPVAAPAPAAPTPPTPAASTPTAPVRAPSPAPSSTPTPLSHITPETVPGKGSIVTDTAGREHVVTGSGGGYMFAAPIGDNGEVQGNRERAFNLKLGDRNSQAFATGRMHGVSQSKPASENAGESGGSGGAVDASPSANIPATPATAPTSAPSPPTAPAAPVSASSPAATTPTPSTAPTNTPSASGEGKSRAETPKAPAAPERPAEAAPVASAAPAPTPAPTASPAPTAPPAPLSAADQAHHEAARKLGATPVAGSKPVRFSRTGLAKGDNGHANGSVHEINGKRYIQTDRTGREYLSRDWLEDNDEFDTKPGGSYNWTGVEVEPNEEEKAYDAARATHAAAVKEREATVQQIKKALQNRENIPQAGPGNTRPSGMEPAWQSPRAPGSYAPSDVISTNGEHVELHQPVYDDAPMVWRAHNPELAKAAASLREPLHPPARPAGVRGPKFATFEKGGTGPKSSITKPAAPKPAASAASPTAPGHHEKMVSDRHAAQQPINTRGDTYNNKDALKALGARWNGDRKSWEFTPHKMTADQRKALVSQMDKLASKGVVFYSQRLAGSPTILAPEKALYSMVASAFSSRFQAIATPTTFPHQRKGN